MALSEDTKKELTRLFRQKDIDGSGTLDAVELEQCLPLMGLYPTAQEIKFLLKAFDVDKDGKLQISELVENAHILIANSLATSDIIDAFKYLDLDKSGYIRLYELKKVLCYNKFMTEKEADDVIADLRKNFDKDGDGKFSYAEFVEMYLSDKFEDNVLPNLKK